MNTVTLSYREAVYVAHVLENHIRDEEHKKVCSYKGNCRGNNGFPFCKEHYKGDFHLNTCRFILDAIRSQMKGDITNE